MLPEGRSSWDRLLDNARGAGGAKASRRVRLSWPPSIFGRQSVMGLVEAFGRAFPDVTVDIAGADGEASIDIFVKNEADVALTLREDAAEYTGVVCAPLFDAFVSCIVSESHPLAGLETVAWDDPATQRFILIPESRYPGSYSHMLGRVRGLGGRGDEAWAAEWSRAARGAWGI